MGNVFGRTASHGYGAKNRRTPAQIRAKLVERQRLMCSGRNQNSIDQDKNARSKYAAFSKVPTREWVDDRFETSRAYNLPRNVRGQYSNLTTESERKRWREQYLARLRQSMNQGARYMKQQCDLLTKQVSTPGRSASKTTTKKTTGKKIVRGKGRVKF